MLKNPNHQSQWLHYNEPAFLKAASKLVSDDKHREITLVAENIRCAACGLKIEKILSGKTGIQEAHINPHTRTIRIVWDETQLKLSAILQILSESGFDAVPVQTHANGINRENRDALKRLIVAGIGMMQVMMYAVGLYTGAFYGISADMQFFLQLLSLLVTTPVVFYSGKMFFTAAINDLSHKRVGMDVPVALAIALAYGCSVWATLIQQGTVYYDSVTMFIFFLSLGRYAEMKARHRSEAATDTMSRLTPLTATRVSVAEEQVVTINELHIGDTILIKPGETVPTDCIVTLGNSRVDESLLTGEFEPQTKTVGDKLIGGSINHDGVLHATVEKLGNNTVLSHITRLLERAQSEKPYISRLTDKLAVHFVTAVLLIALAVGLIWWNIDPSQAFPVVLAVLVVTCPCALSLATPAAMTVAIGHLAKQGVLVSRSNAVEFLTGVNHILFDKTGTLTYGRPKIKKVHTLGSQPARKCLNIAASIERYSEHPVATAFKNNDSILPAYDIENFAGAGIQARIDDQVYRIGTADFVQAPDFASNDCIEKYASMHRTGNTGAIVLGSQNEILALFELEDGLRPFTSTVLKKLRTEVGTVEIVSGDHQAPVEKLADELEVNAKSRLTPEGKLRYIRTLQEKGNKVLMVGDGVNDAPVLAAANVSIAMADGTSLAQTSADIVLMRDSLSALPATLQTANRTMKIIRQNFLWAISYNAIALPLAATGMLAPWVAAIGMSASSLLVVLNALRIASTGKQQQSYRVLPQEIKT